MNTGVTGIFLFSDFYYLRLNVTYSIIEYEMIHLQKGDLHGTSRANPKQKTN